ncbi:MAG: hypothetical protein M1829_004910 [Trizodia sp. TS-e1964]|nr:MAG: hypothetical protein M1829_004910 [Trizodia sp. TS-e1964]
MAPGKSYFVAQCEAQGIALLEAILSPNMGEIADLLISYFAPWELNSLKATSRRINDSLTVSRKFYHLGRVNRIAQEYCHEDIPGHCTMRLPKGTLSACPGYPGGQNHVDHKHVLCDGCRASLAPAQVKDEMSYMHSQPLCFDCTDDVRVNFYLPDNACTCYDSLANSWRCRECTREAYGLQAKKIAAGIAAFPNDLHDQGFHDTWLDPPDCPCGKPLNISAPRAFFSRAWKCLGCGGIKAKPFVRDSETMYHGLMFNEPIYLTLLSCDESVDYCLQRMGARALDPVLRASEQVREYNRKHWLHALFDLPPI